MDVFCISLKWMNVNVPHKIFRFGGLLLKFMQKLEKVLGVDLHFQKFSNGWLHLMVQFFLLKLITVMVGPKLRTQINPSRKFTA